MRSADCTKCGLSIPLRQKAKIPEKCPACGYRGSKVDRAHEAALLEDRQRAAGKRPFYGSIAKTIITFRDNFGFGKLIKVVTEEERT